MNLTTSEKRAKDVIYNMLDAGQPITPKRLARELNVKTTNAINHYYRQLNKKGVIVYETYTLGNGLREYINYSSVKKAMPEATDYKANEDRLIDLANVLEGAAIELREISASMEKKESPRSLLKRLMEVLPQQ